MRPFSPSARLGVVAGFNWSGMPAATKIAKLAAEFVVRHNAHADFVRYEDDGAGELADSGGEGRNGGARIPAGQHEIAQPEGRAIDDDHPARLRMDPERYSDVERFLKGRPALAPVGPVACDARRHFLVPRRRGREIKPLRPIGLSNALRVAAFPGARAAEHE